MDQLLHLTCMARAGQGHLVADSSLPIELDGQLLSHLVKWKNQCELAHCLSFESLALEIIELLACQLLWLLL